MRGQAPSEFPDPFDRGQLRAVRWQEEQAQLAPVLVQQRSERARMVVGGVVEHQDHAPAWSTMAQQAAQKGLERLAVEDGGEPRHQATRVQVHCAKARHGLPCRRVHDHRIAALRRNPHAAPRSVLLEVTFVYAPQINVAALCQAPQFFLQPTPPTGRPARLEVAVCAGENPSA